MTTETKSLIERFAQTRRSLFDNEELVRGGIKWCHQQSDLADALVRHVYETACSDSSSPDVALVATGGYGRRELAPRSDIDIAFVPLREDDPEIEQQVRLLFRLLIDVFAALEWPVGYAYRLLSDLASMDPTSRSSLIDGRLVCGPETAWVNMQCWLWERFPHADFIIDKLRERALLHQKWLRTPHLSEPHLRDGVGGLRDFQTAEWISAAAGVKPQRQPSDAYQRILTVRNALHIVTDRKQDQLVRARRSDVATLLKVDREDLSANLFEAFEEVRDYYADTIWDVRRAKLRLALGVSSESGECQIEPTATLSNAALGISRAVKLGLRILPVNAVGEDGDVPRFTQLLTRDAQTLRALCQAGLLKRMLPELHRCFVLLSNDSVHSFTVAEHTLRVIELLDASQTSEQFSDVWAEVTDSRPLYLGALLHDIGKFDEKKPHSISGAEMAREICARFEMSSDESDTVIWIVSSHLQMAQIARTHDLAIPETSATLAELCGSAERLAMLYLLTVADISAVSEETWTLQLGASLQDLYRRTLELLKLPERPEVTASYRSEGVRRLQAAGRDGDDVETLLQTMPTHYLLGTPMELFPVHAQYVRRAQQGEIIVTFQSKSDTNETELTICVHDLPEPGLLSRILGVLYAHDISVHAVRVASTVGPNPIALDMLTIAYHSRVVPSSLCSIVATDLRECITDANRTRDLMIKLGKDPDRKQSLFTYDYHEGAPGVLAIETPPGRGMPYRVTNMLATFGWNVEVARIGLWAGRAVARFYLGLPGGETLSASQVHQALSTMER